MGSGMLPCGAYITLEHETVLILRKPQKREFKNEHEKQNRRQSSYFWEERNIWFSDIWMLNGARQELNSKDVRKRSGAFPLEIPFRLINMFSSKSDIVLDPFTGTGTTTLAATICGRNSIGYELDESFSSFHQKELTSQSFTDTANKMILKRIKEHRNYIADYEKNGKQPDQRQL